MILSLTDVRDELIRPVVEENEPYYLALVDEYLDYLVKTFDSEKSVKNIPIPTPFQVKQLALNYLGYQVCLDKTGGQNGTLWRDGEGNDRWYYKMKNYKNSYTSLEKTMTSEVMLGDTTKGRPSLSIKLWRS